MDDLVEFLLARITEDAGIAESVSPSPWHAIHAGDDGTHIISLDFGEEVAKTDHLNFEHIAHWQPTRVLAECEAKRLIIENYSFHMFDEEEYAKVLRWLALPYADHSDYEEKWKP